MSNRIITFTLLIGVILVPIYGKENFRNENSLYLRNRRHAFGGLFRTCFNQGPRNRGRSICQQKCVDTLMGPLCSCWPGFRLASDAISCLDIDECSSGIVRCHQICRNTLGSYKCLCRPGYTMQANGRTCTIISIKRRISASPRPGRHAQARHSERLYWDHKKTLLDQDYDDIYEGRDEDLDDGIDDLYVPSRDFTGGGKEPYHWRGRPNPQQTGAQHYGELPYSASPCQQCHQMCYWSSSGGDEVKCGCWHGYAIAEGSDVGCTDLDECSVHQNLCLNGACINTIGSFICRCRPGYLLVRNTCVDINECAGIAGSQLCDHVCINTPGSYHCSCHRGYSISDAVVGNSPTSECVDIDECSLGSCSHLCSNYPGGFICSCPDGMELHHDGRTCIAILEQNSESDFDLSKHNGGYGNRDYPPESFFTASEQVIGVGSSKKNRLNQVGHGIQNVLKSYANAVDNCSVICLNGGTCKNGTCHCPVGITGEMCQKDVNECLFLPSDMRCTHRCINTFGSYLCSCPPGHFLNSDHRSCSSMGCMPFCMNGGTCDYSSGKCTCPLGYTGAACDVDVDECEQNNSGLVCQHECRNTLGSFRCLCLGRGKILGSDGRSCVTAPELSVCVPSCRNGGTCQSIPGGHNICVCPSEFEGHLCQFDVNECSRNSSLCSHHCVNSYGGYKCLCPSDHRTLTDENNKQILCLPDGGTVYPQLPLEPNRTKNQQIYQFSVKEDTQTLENVSSANQLTDDHVLSSSERKDPSKRNKMKVLIEIIVSTVSSPGCNTSHSVYAPIYIALPSKHDSKHSLSSSSALRSTSIFTTILLNSSGQILNYSKTVDAKEGIHDVVDQDSSLDLLSTSFFPFSSLKSSLPNGSVEHSALIENNYNNLSVSVKTDSVASRRGENETAALSSVLLQSLAPHLAPDNEHVPISSTPTLDVIVENSSLSFTSEPKNISSENVILSSVREINSTSTNAGINIPNANESVSNTSQYVSSSTIISPSTVDTTEINLPSEFFQVDVPLNSTFDSLSLMESTEGSSALNHNENESLKSQVNDFSRNVTQIQKSFLDSQNISTGILIKVDEIGNLSLKVNQEAISPTAVTKDFQNITNQEVSNKTDEIHSMSSKVIKEAINQTAGFKEGRKSEAKTEKLPGKKQKSKKGKKNKRKGRKVLKLNQDFEVLNQVIHLPDDKDENLNENVDLLIEMKESEGSSSFGGRYFEILDYGDDDDDWNTNKHTDGFGHPKTSSGLTLPSPSATPKSSPPLGVIWKERPGASELECHYNGKKFPSRSTFFRDEKNCTQCVCKDGEIRCAPRHCPPLHCESPIEGDCCSYCPGDCVFGQQVFLPGERFSPHLDPCRECRCEKGARAICQDIVCPPLNCDPEFRAIMPGECCPACLPPEPGCFHRGRFFYQGQLWVRQEGGCHACLCKKDGEVQCNPVVCVVNCQHPQFVTGECCPLCDGCQYHNQKYSDQQIFPHPTDKCSLCQCQQGNITCFPRLCTSNCSHPYKLTPNQCCPDCKDCLFNGHRISNGSSLIVSQDSCKECTCMSGEVTCKESSCVADCVLVNKTWPSGAEFSPGHDPCTVCRCWDGAITCRALSCPKDPKSCSHGILLPGSCCLHCEQCDYQGKLYNDLEVFQPNEDNCLRCLCNKGNVTCEDTCTEEKLS